MQFSLIIWGPTGVAHTHMIYWWRVCLWREWGTRLVISLRNASVRLIAYANCSWLVSHYVINNSMRMHVNQPHARVASLRGSIEILIYHTASIEKCCARFQCPVDLRRKTRCGQCWKRIFTNVSTQQMVGILKEGLPCIVY